MKEAVLERREDAYAILKEEMTRREQFAKVKDNKDTVRHLKAVVKELTDCLYRVLPTADRDAIAGCQLTVLRGQLVCRVEYERDRRRTLHQDDCLGILKKHGIIHHPDVEEADNSNDDDLASDTEIKIKEEPDDADEEMREADEGDNDDVQPMGERPVDDDADDHEYPPPPSPMSTGSYDGVEDDGEHDEDLDKMSTTTHGKIRESAEVESETSAEAAIYSLANYDSGDDQSVATYGQEDEETVRKYKSAEYIEDSDDEAESGAEMGSPASEQVDISRPSTPNDTHIAKVMKMTWRNLSNNLPPAAKSISERSPPADDVATLIENLHERVRRNSPRARSVSRGWIGHDSDKKIRHTKSLETLT